VVSNHIKLLCCSEHFRSPAGVIEKSAYGGYFFKEAKAAVLQE
jgi:hypothetical protein